MLKLTLAYMAGFATCLAICAAWYYWRIKPRIRIAEERLKGIADVFQGTYS